METPGIQFDSLKNSWENEKLQENSWKEEVGCVFFQIQIIYWKVGLLILAMSKQWKNLKRQKSTMKRMENENLKWLKLRKSMKRKGLLSLAWKVLRVESCILRVIVLLLKRNVICHFLPKQTLFAILCKKKELISELDCVLKKLNDEFKNI